MTEPTYGKTVTAGQLHIVRTGVDQDYSKPNDGIGWSLCQGFALFDISPLDRTTMTYCVNCTLAWTARRHRGGAA